MSFIANWSSVRQLNLAYNQLRTATAPTSQELTYLDLNHNELTNFSDFSFDEDNYVTLDLSDNNLILVSLPDSLKYKYLALHGNPLKSIPLASSAKGITLSIDYWDGISVESVAAVNVTTFYIIDCPPNRIVELEQAAYGVTLLSRSEIGTTIEKPPFSEF
jgi:hypothetical protein